MKLKLLSLIGLISLFTSCDKSNKKLFTQKNNNETGIDFKNTLIENDSMNYFTYAYMYMGGGVAVGDINNDGLDDLFFTGNMVENRLYLNQGNLEFKDITVQADVQGTGKWYTGVTMADVNDDGLLDIYCSVAGKFGDRKNELYINNGDLSFSERADEFGLDDSANSVQASFFDFDKDGDLDVYIANYPITSFDTSNSAYLMKSANPKTNERDRLMENIDGKFVDITDKAGVKNFGLSLSVTVADVNNDSWPDIYISNDFSTPDYFYINQGDGTFKNKVKETTRQTAFYGMGVDIADFNNDELLDIVQVDMMAKDNRRAKANMASMNPALFWGTVNSGFHYQYMHNMLQMNNGNLEQNNLPSFSNTSKFADVSSTDWSWGPLFVDLDNDGLKDLFISNGTRREINNRDYFNLVGKDISENGSSLEKSLAIPSEPIDNFVYRNPGTFPFVKMNKEWGIEFEGFSNGCVYADLDNDGDLEIITNNIDDEIGFFENHSSESTNYVQFNFQGPKGNSKGLGVRVKVKNGSQTQMQELTSSRGFQSSVAPKMHFGIGKNEKIEQVEIIWPDGKKQLLQDLEINKSHTINYSSASIIPELAINREPKKIFITKKDSLKFPHYYYFENFYDDYIEQVLLPHSLSQFGPALAQGDFNQDGLEDFIVGGAYGYPTQVFIQTQHGFEAASNTAFERDKNYEDMGILPIDINNDGYLDLYISSGGNEFEPGDSRYSDRLYLNDGSGEFTKIEGALPELNYSSGRVFSLDFDNDGDQDILVSSRLIPDHYPSPASSVLLENVGSGDIIKFKDVTQDKAEALINIGLLTDASVVDLNADGYMDLVLVGEWMPVTLLENNKGKFEDSSANYGLNEDSRGWWWSSASADFDGDGDLDFIFGNNGLNYKYKAKEKETFDIFVKDFDKNAKEDIVLSYYNDGEQFPVRGRECSSQQIPAIKQKFKNYDSYSKATLVDVYTEDELEEALHYQIKSFASVYAENRNGKLVFHKLPELAQISNINQILIDDYDNDGILDAVIAGNLYQSEVETPRNDAGIGLFLKGKTSGGFDAIPARKSGLYIPGDTKELIQLNFQDKPIIIAGKNQDYLQYIQINK
ncbi:MAG: VCBS repeat-containing protein [Flavobacteriaceae bacterium]